MNLIVRHAHLATVHGEGYGEVMDGALWAKDGRIAWLGPDRSLHQEATGEEVDAEGAWLTPGLIDCHTHLVHAGNRSLEFEMRLEGRSYVEIAQAGGGIASTMRATRAATFDELLATSTRRAEEMIEQGVTTVEIKSGYGLSLEAELKCLRVARRLGENGRIHVEPTLLAAHAIPPEFAGRPDAYVDLIVEEIVPAVAREGLATSVDAFQESIAFTADQVRRVFRAAQSHGLAVRLHADQLSNTSGGAVAAEFGARSADHLEYVDDESLRAMASAGTVAVILPGAYYALRESRKPPVDRMRAHGLRFAVATDANPGSSPTRSLPLAMNMACVLFGMTPCEAFRGVTINAAQALGLAERKGTLSIGCEADLALFAIDHPRDLSCHFGANFLRRSWRLAQPVIR